MFSIKLHHGPFEAVEEVRRTIPLDHDKMEINAQREKQIIKRGLPPIFVPYFPMQSQNASRL